VMTFAVPAALRRRYPFAALARPMTGVMSGVSAINVHLGEPRFQLRSTSVGNMTMAFPHVHSGGGDLSDRVLGGAGADMDGEIAWLRAVVEGAERYAMSVHEPADFIVDTNRALGDAALDLRLVPVCSPRELADPRCPLRAPDRDAPIRWVRGYSLTDRRERLVPAIMTHLFVTARAGERFWNPISTGVAAHTSLAAALVSAICEVIERDAIALTWLLRLPLARIETSAAPPQLATSLAHMQKTQVASYLFDATTDLGVPTVYAVQTCDGKRAIDVFVGCATSCDAEATCVKTLREMAAGRSVVRLERTIPERIEDFIELSHGAAYYARGGRRDAFAFLLDGEARTDVGAMAARAGFDTAATDEDKLAILIDRLRAGGHDVIAVDLTTDELRAAGLWVVRVVIPGLMPFTTVHRARYLGTPRLYEYPRRAGFVPRDEADINPDPQPFA